MSSPNQLKETDMYPPLKLYLEAQGYTVRGEVGLCDVAAEKDGTLVVVELKLRPSLTLLSQAVERWQYADAVYIALPAVGSGTYPGNKGLRRLLSRLEIGFLVVRFLKKSVRVEIVMHPGDGRLHRRPKRRGVILKEMAGRDLDLTPGGLQGGKGRVSAYRQRAIRLAVYLQELGEASPARLRELGASPNCGTMLSQNLYGWFTRLRRGVYTLDSSGIQALQTVPELSELYQKDLRKRLKSAG